jgi:D-glycero-alpha-D-manno-heptose 1-phosphate guanylyltransferase
MPSRDVIVLAGGFGTRLREVVPDLPKPLAPVAGRPFLAHLLDMYVERGMRRAILAVGYRADQVRAVLGKRWQTMELAYSEEPEPLGTGGAITLAMKQVGGDAVHVANGDTFLRYDPLELERVTRALGCPLGMALADVPDIGRYGAVDVDPAGRVAGFAEKGGQGPGLINAGSYFLADPLVALPEVVVAFSFETEVLQPFAAAGRVATYTDTRDFIDIGVPHDYARAQALLDRPA